MAAVSDAESAAGVTLSRKTHAAEMQKRDAQTIPEESGER